MKKPVHSLEQLKDYLHLNYPQHTLKINLGSQYQIPVGPSGIQLLSQYLSWNIEQLNISVHAVKDEGLQILIKSELCRGQAAWKSLKQFAAFKNQLTSEGFKGIQMVNWPCLESLILNENKIDHMGCQLFIRGRFSRSLRKLFLGTNNIGIAGCEALSRSDWPNFQRLGLTYNFITNEGLAFLTLANWPQLLEINLSNNKVDAHGMVYLQKANWPKLEILSLARNLVGFKNQSQLTDFGCFHIAKMKTRSIKTFGISGNDISVNGIRMIFRSGILVPNCFLQLMKNMFTFAEVRPYLQEFNLFCNQFDE